MRLAGYRRSSATNLALLSLLILAIGVFYGMTIREGHDWGDDFAMYIHHAKNLVEGNPYKATGYLYNPGYPSYSHDMYPPVFPLLLAPVYALYGLHLGTMKLLIVLVWAGCLALLLLSFRRELPAPYLALCIAATALNPSAWDFKDNVLSDIPFLFFCLLAVLLIDRAYKRLRPRQWQLGDSLMVGTALYLAYGTRAIALVLIPSLLLFDLLRARRITYFALGALLVFVALAGLQNALVRARGSYLSLLTTDVRYFYDNILAYIGHTRILLSNGYSRIAARGLAITVSALAACGYLGRWRDGLGFGEIFTMLYALAIVVWPFDQGFRYMLPLVPFLFFYGAAGLRRIERLLPRRARAPVFLVLAVLILGSYGARYTTLSFGPIPSGIGTQEARELFSFVRKSTEPTDVLLFRKPRALALITGRRASVFSPLDQDADRQRLVGELGADYVIVQPKLEMRTLVPFLERNRALFDEVYANADFRVYRVI